jgi:predicted transposase/invertase (TIGR01784 family)
MTQNDINNPHDKFFKAAFSIYSVAVACLKQFLPKDLLAKLNLDALEIDNNSYIKDELAEYFADIVWRCPYKHGDETLEIAFLFEHKSYKPSHPHFQLSDYLMEAYKSQVGQGRETLTPILPIVLYHGQAEWVKKPFESYFGKHLAPEVLPFLPRFDYVLINLADFSDEILSALEFVLLKKVLLLFKHYQDKEYLEVNYMKLIFDELGGIRHFEAFRYVETSGRYIATLMKITRVQFKEKVKTSAHNLKSEAMTFIDEFIEEGKEIGKEIGKDEQKHEFTVKLLNNTDWSFEKIADFTDTTVEYVQAIFDELSIEKLESDLDNSGQNETEQPPQSE